MQEDTAARRPDANAPIRSSARRCKPILWAAAGAAVGAGLGGGAVFYQHHKHQAEINGLKDERGYGVKNSQLGQENKQLGQENKHLKTENKRQKEEFDGLLFLNPTYI